MTTMVMATGGVGILVTAWLATSALRRARASLRHLIWLAALAAILALPLLERSGLDVEVPIPSAWMHRVERLRAPAPEPTPWVADVASAADAPSPGPTAEIDHAATGDRPANSGARPADTGARPEVAIERGDGYRGPAAGLTAATSSGRGVADALGGARSAADGSSEEGVFRTRPSAADVLGAIWALGLLGLLVTTVVQQLQARRLTVRQVEPVSASARLRFGRLLVGLGIERSVRLVTSSRLRVPATWGLFRATIVLPADYARWSAETLDRVLLHELAHVRRRDCVAYLVGEIARALHWPNPLAWLALHRLKVESERAADDRVLSFTDTPSAYAEDLVSMVRALKGGAVTPRAAIAMASPAGVSSRVRAILDPDQQRGPVAKPVGVIVALVALGLAAAATVLTPVAHARETAGADRGWTAPRASAGSLLPESPAGSSPAELPPSVADAPSRASATDPELETLGRAVLPAATDAAAPQSQERLCVFREGGSRSTSVNMNDDEIRIRWETDDCRVEIDIEGDVEFAADDTDVVAMARGALFEIEERVGRTSRRARLEAGSGGGIDRQYWEDGDPVAWRSAAQRWLAQILPEIFRHSTINAEARVRRMLEEGGPDRVFREVAQIRSDHVTRTYLELMMRLGQLSESDYQRVIEVAGSIDSDHGSASLLMSVIEEAGLRPAFQGPLLRASEGLDSDHERTRVLQALLRSPLSAAQLDAVLRSARSIDSDHNLSQVLSEIAEAGRLDDAGRASFLEALRSIGSDHSKGVVIDAFLDTGPLTDDELAQVLAMTEDIGSDHERGRILRSVAEEYPLTGSQVTAYLTSAARLDSDHEASRTAIAVIDGADFDAEQVGLVLRMADDVGSDHDRGEILIALIERRELTPDEVAGLLAVGRDIGSDHRLGQVLTVLIEEQNLDSAGIEGVLSTLERVGSGHDRMTVMVSLADRFEIGGRALALYEDLADDLSRHERERVLAAVSR